MSLQLVKCQVTNSHGETSFRLIERDNFDLWRFLVTTKHQLRIEQSWQCLWVSDDEYRQREAIYARAGDIESANRLLLMMYDEHGNFSNTTRYVLNTDTDVVEKRLISHIPAPIYQTGQYSLDKEAGLVITTGVLNLLSLESIANIAY